MDRDSVNWWGYWPAAPTPFRIPVVVGCTCFTAAGVVERVAHAADIGASGVLSTPSPYVHPMQAEIVAFFEEIDKNVRLPPHSDSPNTSPPTHKLPSLD